MKDHYLEDVGKPYFKELMDYATMGPVVVMVWEGHNSIALARKIIGKMNPKDAAPGSIRGDYANELRRNMVHASENVEAVQRELSIWFELDELHDWNICDNKFIHEK